ncbi:hypothetical protein D3C75_588300 [compost metagenome]
MYITRDYLKVGSWQAVIDMINDKYNFQLQAGVVQLKEMKKLGPKLTQVEIIPNRSTNPGNLMPEITETVFTYDRLNCTEFFRNTFAVDIRGLTLPITTFDILKKISARNDIVFEVDDFVHQTFDHFSAVGENDFNIQANEKSLRFVGFLKVRLTNTSKLDLATYTTPANEFPNVIEEPDNTKINGDYYVSSYDFSRYRDSLKDLKVGLYHNPEQLLNPLFQITGIKFQCQSVPAINNIVHSLVNGERHCKVLYNGATIPKWTMRSEFYRVVVLELSDLSSNITGFLRLHYD